MNKFESAAKPAALPREKGPSLQMEYARKNRKVKKVHHPAQGTVLSNRPVSKVDIGTLKNSTDIGKVTKHVATCHNKANTARTWSNSKMEDIGRVVRIIDQKTAEEIERTPL